MKTPIINMIFLNLDLNLYLVISIDAYSLTMLKYVVIISKTVMKREKKGNYMLNICVKKVV